MREVEISKEPVELYKLLKFESLVSRGKWDVTLFWEFRG